MVKKIIKPKKLEKGDTIAFISPSSNFAVQVPHRVDSAKKYLEKQGYKVIIARNALLKEDPTLGRDFISGTVSQRVEDIMSCFKNPEIKAIICMIGGDWCNELIEHLDYQTIKKNPKIFSGYSDITVLHHAIHSQTGIVTFYGPAVLPQFGEYPVPLQYTFDSFIRMVGSNEPYGVVLPSKKWTDEVLDWTKKEDLKHLRRLNLNSGYEWLVLGKTQGQLTGGCLSSLKHIFGTKYQTEFRNKILFWELSEGNSIHGGITLNEVEKMLDELISLNIAGNINGMIIGRPYQYTYKQKTKLKQMVVEKFAEFGFPILYRVDIGHTDPIITVPYGLSAVLDSKDNSFRIIDNAVE